MKLSASLIKHKVFCLVPIFVCLLFLPTAVRCQNFEISGESSLSGNFTLTIYDGDSSSHTLTCKANKGLFLFTGQVSSPVLAALSHPSMSQPLYFYVENSEISVALNATHPELSVIRNSRTNSEYRYLMERYRSAAEPSSFLIQYARQNPESIYLPFVIHQQMGNLDDGALRQLITLISGAARNTYHYTLLRRWLRETPAVSEGSEMPNFAYLDSNKEHREFANSRNLEGHTLVLFTATWCGQCHDQQAQAQRLIGDKPISLLTINIDDNPNGWDAHYLQQLSVNHIPYFILIDPAGIVTARDLRHWELPKALAKIK